VVGGRASCAICCRENPGGSIKVSINVCNLGGGFSSGYVIFNKRRKEMSLLEFYALGSAMTAAILVFIYFLARKA